MDGYEVKVYYSPNDDCYVAQIVEFVGCAADGDTPEEALESLRELKDIWIKTVQENGYPVPPPRHARNGLLVAQDEARTLAHV